MTYDDLVEETAKSIFDHKYSASLDWGRVPEFVQQIYRDHARATLPVIYRALREPTSEMIDAANRARPSSTSRTLQAAIEASPLNPDDKN
jgi:hypothetical protein